MDAIIIRTAKISDLPFICDFQLRMAMETENIELDPLILEAGISAIFRDPSKGVYYVAESGGKTVASLMITYEWSDWRNGLVWWIQSVFIDPGYRKQGIFKLMFEKLKDTVSNDLSVRGLRLYVDERNHNAQAVYKAIGMDGGHYRVFEWMK